MLNKYKLFELMQEKDIKSLKQLSKDTKIAYNTIIYMVDGHDMHVSTIIELSRFFNVPIDYLINTSYGITIISDTCEEFIKTSSILEASFLKML